MQQLQLHELDNARQEHLFNRLRTAVQPLHHEQQYIILLLLASYSFDLI